MMIRVSTAACFMLEWINPIASYPVDEYGCYGLSTRVTEKIYLTRDFTNESTSFLDVLRSS
jgi:hypothetical protein